MLNRQMKIPGYLPVRSKLPVNDFAMQERAQDHLKR
jgi:hypothetical protein